MINPPNSKFILSPNNTHPLREKCPDTEFFLVLIFHTWTECGKVLRISVCSV